MVNSLRRSGVHHIRNVVKDQNEVELWTAATAGQTITPRVDFPAQYAGRVYWQISDGTVKPATSGAEISHTFAANGPHRARLIGVPVDQIMYLSAASDYLTGDISKIRWNWYRNLATLSMAATGVSGDIASLAGLSKLEILSLSSTGVSGDIASLAGLSKLAYLYLYSTSATCGSTFTASWVGMRDFRVQDCSMSQAAVGNIVESIWTARAGFTYATPALNIGGTNAAPAGNVAAPPGGGASNSDWSWDGAKYIPLTAGAMIWDLAKDVNSKGFKKWSITYTGGSI